MSIDSITPAGLLKTSPPAIERTGPRPVVGAAFGDDWWRRGVVY